MQTTRRTHTEKTTTLRRGDILVTTTTRIESAVVEWADILDAITIAPDDMTDAPWDNCDGFDHETTPAQQCENAESRRGCCWDTGNRERVVVSVAFDGELHAWCRARGASRQVAREMVALSARRTIDALTHWLEHGWEWWVVSGDILGCGDSLGGIDDYDYAKNEVVGDIADNLAYALEQAGYTITGRPEAGGPHSEIRKNRRDNLHRNLSLFSWMD
jgi:hypothetical protein